MKSVDTNLLVRVIIKDDPDQAVLAGKAFEEPVFVSQGVIMETEWVLRSGYGLSRLEIADALTKVLLELGTVRLAAPSLVAWSLARYAAGADLADMLHLVSSRGHTAFLTFDSKLERAAGPDAPVRVEQLG